MLKANLDILVLAYLNNSVVKIIDWALPGKIGTRFLTEQNQQAATIVNLIRLNGNKEVWLLFTPWSSGRGFPTN